MDADLEARTNVRAIRNAMNTAAKVGSMALAARDWDFYRQLLSIHAYWCGSARYWRRYQEATP